LLSSASGGPGTIVVRDPGLIHSIESCRTTRRLTTLPSAIRYRNLQRFSCWVQRWWLGWRSIVAFAADGHTPVSLEFRPANGDVSPPRARLAVRANRVTGTPGQRRWWPILLHSDSGFRLRSPATSRSPSRRRSAARGGPTQGCNGWEARRRCGGGGGFGIVVWDELL
jgi:hypothetical protein